MAVQSPQNRRPVVMAAFAAVLLSGLLVPLLASPAQARVTGVGPDFNGDGFADLAIGAPNEDIGPIIDAGAITVIYGSSNGVTTAGATLIHQGSAGIPGGNEPNDHWGNALDHGDFNGDGFDDIAVGADLEAVGTLQAAGAVTILYGSANGIATSGNKMFHQGTPGVPGANEANDRWGSALAVGDFNADGWDDLAISAPTEDIGAAISVGAVTILFGSSGGLSISGAQLLHQNSAGIPGGNETQDFWGLRLVAADFNGDQVDDLAVGAPFENVGEVNLAGAVTMLYGSTSGITPAGAQLLYQGAAGVPDTSEILDFWSETLTAGDFDGDGFADLVVGEPRKDLNFQNVPQTDVGAVTILYGSAAGVTSAGAEVIHQGVAGIPGQNSSGDKFGSAVIAGDFNGDSHDDLAIGVIGDDFGNAGDAGSTVVLFGWSGGLLDTPFALSFHQDTTGVAGANETSDGWGALLNTADLDGDGNEELVVHAPNESVGAAIIAGAVTTIDVITTGLGPNGSKIFHQGSVGMPGVNEIGDQWGAR